MFLRLIKRALKATMHAACEEWLLEIGMPRDDVERARAKREALAADAEAHADAAAAQALGVEDGETCIPTGQAALPVPSAARVIAAGVHETCPAPRDEGGLMRWVQHQREQGTSWAEVARKANDAGHDLGEGALRTRLRRWNGASVRHAPA